MAYTKTIDDCDDYFKPKNHIKSNSWNKFLANDKEGAFNQALRELQVKLGRLLVDPSDDDAVYRDDYGHFEQCIYILENTPRQEMSGVSSAIDIADSDETDDKDNTRQGVLISPMAWRYFQRARIKMLRG